MSGLLFIDLNVRTFRPLTSFPNDKNDNLLSQITNYSIKEKISPKVEYSKTLDLNNN